MKIGVELSGIPATDRARGFYLIEELINLGYETFAVDDTDNVDVRIMLKRDFQRRRPDNEIRIFDMSDAILTPPKSNGFVKRHYQEWVVNKRVGKFLGECDAVIVACELQRIVASKYNRSTIVIPDSSYYHASYDQLAKPDIKEKLVFVWDGQGHNFPFLEELVRKNVEFFRRSDVLLKVITDKMIDASTKSGNEEKLASHDINSVFISWHETNFTCEVNSAHVGLAPVDMHCSHSLAKPDNKLVNYQGLGLPVLASSTLAYETFSKKSPGGVTVCRSDSDWTKALEFWRQNRSEVFAIGNMGRQYVLSNYLTSILARKWEKVIIDLTG